MDRFDLTPLNTTLLAIDLQERFVSIMPGIAADQPCGRTIRILLQAAQLLRVPVVISEQYPKGLGPTLPYVHEAAPGAAVFAKTHFSCAEDAVLNAGLADPQRSHVVICGVETHVCVLSTAADLLAGGRKVVIAADAVASRDPAHRELGLQALRDLGALVLPVESIVLRLQRQAGIGVFKQLSALIR